MTQPDDWMIDWRWKSFPPSAAGLPASSIADAGWELRRDFATPVAVLKESALAHNLALMRGYCLEHGVQHAPHGKTTMSPELIRRQLDHGAWGMTAASAWQARAMIEFGARRVIVANECVDPVGLRWIAERMRADPGLEICVFADSFAAVKAMRTVLAGVPGARPLPVLAEVGATGGRAGARSVTYAVEVGGTIAASPELTLAGVAGFEGVVGGAREIRVLDGVRQFLGRMRDTARALMAADALSVDRTVLLSAGGSMFFDLVVDELSDDYERPVEVVIRSGCYITHDHGIYRASSPLGDDSSGFRAALELWSRVVSVPEPNLAIIDVGRRDVSDDAGNPPVLERWRGRERGQAGDVTVRAFNDQHGFVHVAEAGTLRVGDVLTLGISHPCTTLDKWRAIPVVDDEYRVIGAVRTFF